MRKGRRKLNQAGMSLVELIVVILIMGILSAGTAVGITYASNMNSTSAAEKLASMLERTRILTTSADSAVKLVLEKDGNEYYGKIYQGSTEVDKVKLGNGSITITVKGGGPDKPIGPSSCEFAYKKSNGAFEDSCVYTSIEVVGSKTKTIQLVKATGRSYIR